MLGPGGRVRHAAAEDAAALDQRHLHAGLAAAQQRGGGRGAREAAAHDHDAPAHRASAPAQERPGLVDRPHGRLGAGAPAPEAVHRPRVAAQRRAHARRPQRGRVRLALVAQDVGLRGDHERRRQPAQVRRAQRRGVRVAAVGAVEVELPEAPHRGAGEAVALRELVRGARVERDVADRDTTRPAPAAGSPLPRHGAAARSRRRGYRPRCRRRARTPARRSASARTTASPSSTAQGTGAPAPASSRRSTTAAPEAAASRRATRRRSRSSRPPSRRRGSSATPAAPRRARAGRRGPGSARRGPAGGVLTDASRGPGPASAAASRSCAARSPATPGPGGAACSPSSTTARMSGASRRHRSAAGSRSAVIGRGPRQHVAIERGRSTSGPSTLSIRSTLSY